MKKRTSSQRRRYSAAEFERAAAISRMHPDNIELARAVLVEGKPQNATGRAAKKGRQRASQVVQKMLQYIERANPVPKGWRTDSVTLPIPAWRKVRALERAARRNLGKRR